jgi:hypothetical protein
VSLPSGWNPRDLVGTTSAFLPSLTPHISPRSQEHHVTRDAIRAYAGNAADELPIEGYAAMIAAFSASLLLVTAAARASGRLPRRLPLRDVLLLGVATHELSRTVTRARVTIPLRVPFTHYEGSDGAGQVREEPRGRGLRRAIGSLLTCQFCTGPWVALGLGAALLYFPRGTRFASGIFAMAAVSDFLHQGYAAARQASARTP